jgi:hypothetical protein
MPNLNLLFSQRRQTVLLLADFFNQILPIIHRPPSCQHLLKKKISIIVAVVCPFAVFVIDPCVNDDFAVLMVTEEEPNGKGRQMTRVAYLLAFLKYS